MCTMTSHIPMEQSEQALSTLKDNYETDEFEIAIVPPERYNDVVDFLEQYFIPDETLCKAFGVTRSAFFEWRMRHALQQNISIMMIKKCTKDIVGIRLSQIRHSSDVSDIDKFPVPQNYIAKFLTQKEQDIDIYNRFGVSKAFSFLAIAVNKSYRGKGLATLLMKACVDLARALGFELVIGDGTSIASQKVFEKCGFESLAVLPYGEYLHEGQPLSCRTGQNTCTKVFARRL